MFLLISLWTMSPCQGSILTPKIKLILPVNRKIKLKAIWFSREIFFLISPSLLFPNYPHFEINMAILWRNLRALLPRMLCAKFRLNKLTGSGDEENENSLLTIRQHTTTTDDGYILIKVDHSSLSLMWAKNIITKCILFSRKYILFKKIIN